MAANRVCYGLRDCGFALRKGSIVLLTIGSAESPKEGPVVAFNLLDQRFFINLSLPCQWDVVDRNQHVWNHVCR